MIRDRYSIKGETDTLQVEIEKVLIEDIQKMSEYTQITMSELVNMAVKGYVAKHRDFLPPSVD